MLFGPDYIKADKIPAGEHTFEIVEIIHNDKSGEPLLTVNGDPYIYLCLKAENHNGRHKHPMVLADQGKWPLYLLLQLAGHDPDDWAFRCGVNVIEDLRNDRIAYDCLYGLEFRGIITYNQDGYGSVTFGGGAE